MNLAKVWQTDIAVENRGTVAFLRPLTEAGRNWLDKMVSAEPWQWLGGALSCEPRFVGAVVDGMVADGLTVA